MKNLNNKIILYIIFLTLLDIFLKFIFQNKNYFDFFISIKYTQNIGSSFGIFSNIIFYNYFVILLSMALLTFIFFKFKKIKKILSKNKFYFFSFIFFLSGVLGNLFDRIFFGYVRDFISIENFFIFNLADFYLSFSILLILLNEINLKFKKVTNQK